MANAMDGGIYKELALIMQLICQSLVGALTQVINIYLSNYLCIVRISHLNVSADRAQLCDSNICAHNKFSLKHKCML